MSVSDLWSLEMYFGIPFMLHGIFIISWSAHFVLHTFMNELTLKLLNMTSRPPSSGPSIFSAGTLTLSNVMYAVPAAVEYDVLICLVSTPSVRGTRKAVKPPSV